MNEIRPVPIGIEDFRRLIDGEYYFIDKTLLIKEILDTRAAVSLFARPRRFGKTLNMSMLKYFFEKSENDHAYLFDGLYISEAGERYLTHMGQYPVISVSLKSMDQGSFEETLDEFRNLIADEYEMHNNILNSDKLTVRKRRLFESIYNGDATMTTYKNSLKLLSDCLYTVYQKKVIILIDEYDVPLQNAWLRGFYQEMVDFIRSLFNMALKTNDSLEFGVLTGCLRISKESIFTGLNNPNVSSISDVQFSEYFGFTDTEVRQMLDFYQLSEHYELTKQWYDGYRFGHTEIYCPWDVIKHCNTLLHDSSAQPMAYWINTSGNDVVKQFISSATATMKEELEQLIAGKTIMKKINQELTYRDLKDDDENIWSLLYMTGYLTMCGMPDRNEFVLRIPNLEIREIFIIQIYKWFKAYAKENPFRLTEFCMMFRNGDAESAQEAFTKYLNEVISIRDNNVSIPKKENFYHGILLGLFSHMSDWSIKSNVESGDGYSDILIKIPGDQIGIVIEVKFGENKEMEEGCREALKQIEDMQYETSLLNDGMTTILKYGVACYKKRCMIRKA